MTIKADLHTHTNHSDGTLSPDELIALAITSGIDMLSITDHDTTLAFEDLRAPPELRVIPGVEFSTTWDHTGIHVVGLGIDPFCDAMQAGVNSQRAVRRERATRIAAALTRAGLPDLWSDACERSGNDYPGRPHFAAGIVASGKSRNTKHAFRRYLGKGRPGNVKTAWADMNTVVDWIQQAGGIAVLAHPARYKIGRASLHTLVKDFVDAGGQALEVISGRQDRPVTQALTALATEYQLLASGGSDFHSPEQRWLRLGLSEHLPRECTPVWRHL